MLSTGRGAWAASVSLSTSSMYFPWRTSPTPANPKEVRACPIAWPCGSRTPGFKVTCTRAFIPPGFCAGVPSLGATAHLGQDAEPPRHLLIGFLDSAQILAEAVLVQLLVGAHVPEPAIVRADSGGDDEPQLRRAGVSPPVF